MVSLMRVFPISILLLVAQGCFTTSDERDDLDVKLEKQPIQDEKSSEKKIPATANIEWQQFFKAAPTSMQRSLLEEELKKSQDPGTAADLIKAARNLVALGKLAEAESSFHLALRKDSGNLDAILGLARLYLRFDKASQTFEYLNKARDIVSEPTQKFRYKYILALSYLRQKEFSKGRAILSDLIKLEPKFTPAYVALATSYLEQDKIKVAKFISKRGLDRAGEMPELVNIMGVVELRLGNETKAKSLFDKALTKNPDMAAALVNRANILIKRSQYDSAEASLLKAIVANPHSVPAYIALGICQKKMGRLEASKSSFERAIEHDPKSSSARFNLAVLMMGKLNNTTIAMRLFNEVIQLEGKSSKNGTLARVYLEDIRSNRSY